MDNKTKELLIDKLATLAVRVGANVQKDQILVISSPLHASVLAKKIQKEAYLVGAKKVYIDWNDDELTRNYYTYAKDETLQEIEDFQLARMKYFVENNACRISIDSRNPHGMRGVDMGRVMLANRAIGPKTHFFQEHYGSSKSQWTIVAYPNDEWCKTVFPDLPLDEAWDKLFEAIMYTSRVSIDKDPAEEWKKHTKSLEDGGNGIYFVPNIPTEEVFTMPHRNGVNGKVFSTKPLNYQGNLIRDFYFVFKDGKVVDYNAKEGYEALKSLVELDEGSSRLGEVALISNNSPISNLNILFNDTLFDENASCHLALGNAYSMNVVGGTTMSIEELKKIGYNVSITHVDFMFGSADMQIVGTTHDGKEVVIFEKGNFVI